MIKLYLLVTLLLAICAFCSKSLGQHENPDLISPYFGQKVPGLTPEIFAPGIVSVDERYEGGVSFSPELDEMYFSASVNAHSVVYYSKRENDTWTSLKEAKFTKGAIKDEFSPRVSHNGKRIYFSTYSAEYPLKIWYVERHKSYWSDAVLLNSPINNAGAIITSEAQNGDLYYTNNSEKKLYYAPNRNGAFMSGHAVRIGYGSLGFISPSQDFLLVEAHKENDKTQDKDVYVHFKEKDGSWSKPINLGKAVNTNHREGGPTMTPDGKYLFFNRYGEASGNPNIYWVSTKIITQLKDTYFKTAH
jgi:hypothetical protein